MNRVKVETLVTIQVHQRDVLGDLGKLYKERKIQDTQDFEWLKQARFEWRPDDNDRHGDGACVISVCDVDFKYCYEYLGVKDRSCRRPAHRPMLHHPRPGPWDAPRRGACGAPAGRR